MLADVVNICAILFENHMYITPAERHMFVKVCFSWFFYVAK